MKSFTSIVRGFLDEFGSRPGVIVSAPGRADFLNTHQDYKGLPVVPVAIKLRCYAAGALNGSRIVRVLSLNLKSMGEAYRDEFSLDDLRLIGGGWFGDYIRAVIKSIIDSGRRVQGMDIVIWSEVPIGAGLSSSASLEIAVAKLVSELCGLNLGKMDLAEIGYSAEHDVMGIPCGRLDQYASAFGGITVLETRPPFKVEELETWDLTFVIVDSGEHRKITSVHPVRQSEINEGLRILIEEVKPPEEILKHLSYGYYETGWEHLVDSLEPYLASLPEKLANRIRFTLRMHRSTLYAIELLRGARPSREGFSKAVGEDFARERRIDFSDRLQVIGAIMNYQHILLRDLYEVSTPRLEDLREALLEAGALGAKISGAGMGGAMIALARSMEAGEEIRRACAERGYRSSWVSMPEEGARREIS
ncbi:MAG: galactokinase family protein [Nitrososphaerota archaeon]